MKAPTEMCLPRKCFLRTETDTFVETFFLILDDGQDPENNTPSTEVKIIEFLALVGVS